MGIEPFELESYPFTIRPLSREDGGGFLVEYPDIRVHVRRRNAGGGDTERPRRFAVGPTHPP